MSKKMIPEVGAEAGMGKEDQHKLTGFTTLIVIMAMTVLFFAACGIFGVFDMPSERDKILDGPPTYEGEIVDIDITAGGGFGNTILYMHNDTIILDGQHDEFVLGHSYRIWTQDKTLLKYEEI